MLVKLMILQFMLLINFDKIILNANRINTFMIKLGNFSNMLLCIDNTTHGARFCTLRTGKPCNRAKILQDKFGKILPCLVKFTLQN